MELKQITRILFRDKDGYKHINSEEKEKLFFIFNRMATRGNPMTSDALNRKGIDGALAMDIWFNYAKKANDIPKWFEPDWRKLKKAKSESVLKNYSNMDKYLLSFYPEAIEEEKLRLEQEKDSIEVVKIKTPVIKKKK